MNPVSTSQVSEDPVSIMAVLVEVPNVILARKSWPRSALEIVPVPVRLLFGRIDFQSEWEALLLVLGIRVRWTV